MGFTSRCSHSSFSHPWRTLLAHLLALHLLHLGSAQYRVVAPNLHYTAIVGQDVVLRCQLSPCKDAWNSEITWIQHHSSGFVHHYQNGLDLEQMEEYKGRTELLRDGLSDGYLDLRINAVSSADSGSYLCAVQDSEGYAEDVLNLEVSDPSPQITHPWKVALVVVVTLLVGSSAVIIVFLHRKQAAQSRKLKRKDAMLVEQAERMERKDEMLVKLLPMLKSSDAELDMLASKLVEISEKLNVWNSQLKMHYTTMSSHASELKNQIAELKIRDAVLEIRAVRFLERTEALEIQGSQLDKDCEEMDSIVADLKKHTEEMERRDVMLEEQVAKLMEQTEASEEPSKEEDGETSSAYQ